MRKHTPFYAKGVLRNFETCANFCYQLYMCFRPECLTWSLVWLSAELIPVVRVLITRPGCVSSSPPPPQVRSDNTLLWAWDLHLSPPRYIYKKSLTTMTRVFSPYQLGNNSQKGRDKDIIVLCHREGFTFYHKPKITVKTINNIETKADTREIIN